MTGLKAQVNGTEVKFSWTAVKNATGYELAKYDDVYRKYDFVAKASSTSATLKNQEAGKTFRFAVRAVGTDAGKTIYGDYSDLVSVKIDEIKPTVTLAKVTGLKAQVNETEATFSWNAVQNANAYELAQVDDTGKTYQVLSRLATTSATLKNLEEGKTYRYAVRAVLIDGSKQTNGDYSDPVTVKIEESKPADASGLVKVTGLKAQKTDATINLSWTAVAGANGYEISTQDGSTYKKVTEVTGTSAKLDSLERHKELNLVVRAFVKSGRNYGYGPYSDSVKVIVYNADYYGAILRSGTFRMTMSEDIDGNGKQDVNIAVKNGNVCFSGSFRMDEKMTIPMEMRYIKSTGKIYMKCSRGWGDVTEMMKNEAGMGDMSYYSEMSNMFSQVYFGNGTDVVMSTETKNGKTYDVETVSKDGKTIKLYTINNEMRYLWIRDSYGVQEMEIKNVSGDVSDSLVTAPKGAVKIKDTLAFVMLIL